MIDVSPGFGVLLEEAATVVVAKAEPSVVAQTAAHSSDCLLLEGISDRRTWPDSMVRRWRKLLNTGST